MTLTAERIEETTGKLDGDVDVPFGKAVIICSDVEKSAMQHHVGDGTGKAPLKTALVDSLARVVHD